MILWVDDNHDLRRAVAEHLTNAGHRVVEAVSAEEALERLESEREDPGLLLTDLRLPAGSGLRLAETLRTRAPDLPVLLVTSHATPGDLGSWQGDEAFALLRKPFEMAELETAVSALLAAETPPFQLSTQVPDADAAPGRTSARPFETGTTGRSNGRNPSWLRLGWVVLLALAVGAAWPWLMPGGAPPGVASPGGAPPQLPDAPSPDDVRRGDTIQTLEPFGPVASAPSAFRWRPAAGAVRYRLQVEDVAGAVLWQTETADAVLALPPELADRLLPLAAYYWRVEALDSAGRTTAASDPVRFRIVEPEVDPEPERSSP